MQRRQVLHLAGVGAVALGSGCTALPGRSGSPAATRTPPTAAPGRPTADQPYPPYTSFHDDVAEVIGYDEGDPTAARLVLEPSTDSRSPPDAEYRFELRNRSDRAFNLNPYSWSVHRWEDGAWWYVAPRGMKLPLLELEPGDSHAWHLSVTNEGVDRPDLAAGGNAEITLRGLGGGTYAFGIDGWWAGREDRRIVASARFSVDADQLTLEPSRAVTGARRSGDTVAVKATNPDDGATTPAIYELQRVAEPSDPAPTITETLLRSWPRRDGFAYAVSGVDRVRIATETAADPPFGVREAWPPVTYEGDTFAISASRREG